MPNSNYWHVFTADEEENDSEECWNGGSTFTPKTQYHQHK